MLQAQNPELRAIQEKYANPFHEIREDLSVMYGVSEKVYVTRHVGELTEMEKNFLIIFEMFVVEVRKLSLTSDVARGARALIAWNDGKGKTDFMLGDLSGTRGSDFMRRAQADVKKQNFEYQTKGNPDLLSPWELMGNFLSDVMQKTQQQPALQQKFEVARILAHEMGQKSSWLSPLIAKEHGVYGG